MKTDGNGPMRAWLLLALGALAVAGALALLLALVRAPGMGEVLPWGVDFFHKGLVAHVVFSFQVWLLAMLGALAGGGRPAWFLSLAGALLLLVPTLAGWGEASLNNYVPVLVHPLFFAGLALLGAGAGLNALSLLKGGFEAAMTGIAVLAGLAAFALALPVGTQSALAVERLFWGGGHVMQMVNTMMLMLAWARLSPRPVLPPLLSKSVFAALALASVVALTAYRLDVLGLPHRQALTWILWYGLPLPPLVMGLGLLRVLDRRSPAFLPLALSLAVFALGGGAGFALGVGDTRTPSHYHAVIGGVNLALMGLIHLRYLPALGREARSRRWVAVQFWLYGGGQLLHALGFYLAGLAGVARKTAGAEQGIDSGFKLVSLGLVGLGGAIAVLGGMIFLVQVLNRLVRHG